MLGFRVLWDLGDLGVLRLGSLWPRVDRTSGFEASALNVTGLRVYFGYCPHPVTVYVGGPMKGYI